MSVAVLFSRESSSYPSGYPVPLNNPLVFRYEENWGVQLWFAYDQYGLGYYISRDPKKNKGFMLHVRNPHAPSIVELLEVDHLGYVSRESEQQRLLQEVAEWVYLHRVDKGELPSDFAGVIV
jgi:hypothetical protein